jgi:transposase
MSKVTVYVGLDYHKDSIQVCVMDTSGTIVANRRCPNQAEDLVKLVASFGDDVRAAIEACSGAAQLADELATEHGWIINLAHPGYVARMKQTPDKTDWADARVIADLVRVGYLPKVWLAPEDVRQLRTWSGTAATGRPAAGDQAADRALLRDARVEEPCSRWTKAWFAWVVSAEGWDRGQVGDH